MSSAQTCPRRMQEDGPWEHRENLDIWVDRHTPRPQDPGPCCSFCGSLHPDMFLDLIASGRWVVEPTDKNYKAYLGEILSMEERTAVPGEPLPPVRSGRAKFYYQHLSPEQQERFVELYNTRAMRLAEPGHFYVLPFFIGIG